MLELQNIASSCYYEGHEGLVVFSFLFSVILESVNFSVVLMTFFCGSTI